MKRERSSSQLHDDPLKMQLNKKNNHGRSSSSSSSSNKEKIRATTTTTEMLSQKIIDEIPYKLPGKSLSLFRCVSKRWLSTISDPKFNLYYKRKSNSVFAITLNSHIPSLYSIDDDDNASSVKAFSLNIPPLILEEYKKFKPYRLRTISNVCNGLVLLRISKDSLVLFNPSTSCYSLKALTLDCLESTQISSCAISIGFCYDTGIDDYKVLVMHPSCNVPCVHRVFVSCLKSKRWLEITHVPFDVRGSIRGPLVNGHIHWTIGTTIAYFEETRNTFEALPLPPDHGQYLIIGLGVLDECLSIARRRRTQIIEGDVEVVAMKKYGVAESWTTLYVLSNMKVNGCLWSLKPLLLSKNGEEVLFIANMTEVWAFNPTSNYSCKKFDVATDKYVCATS